MNHPPETPNTGKDKDKKKPPRIDNFGDVSFNQAFENADLDDKLKILLSEIQKVQATRRDAAEYNHESEKADFENRAEVGTSNPSKDAWKYRESVGQFERDKEHADDNWLQRQVRKVEEGKTMRKYVIPGAKVAIVGVLGYKGIRAGWRGIKAGIHVLRGSPAEAVQEVAAAVVETV